MAMEWKCPSEQSLLQELYHHNTQLIYVYASGLIAIGQFLDVEDSLSRMMKLYRLEARM